MNSKHRTDEEENQNSSKPLRRKTFEKKIGDISSKVKELDDSLKLLNLKVPDKDFYAVQKHEDFARVNDLKLRRGNQFKEKSVVDAGLREVNQQVQIKYDAVGKLRSSLKYKCPQRVDEVIRKLTGQLERLQMKPNEKRRIQQEISTLNESKSRIQDFMKADEEVRQLKEKQKNLRVQRDENVRLITALKQEETAARSVLEQHKSVEDTEWSIYKENLSKRDNLRNGRDALLKERKELYDQYRKDQSIRRDYLAKRDSLRGLHALLLSEQDARPRDSHANYTRTITERKKPFEEDIDLCNVLLTYLARHESHCTTGESSNDINETDSANDLKVDEDVRNLAGQRVAEEVIYTGIRRRPSKRERRRKQHIGEAQKKLEHHVNVLEGFVTLGIQPPAIVAEIPTAKRGIREKKKFLKESQKETLDVMRMHRAKSSPFIGIYQKDRSQKDVDSHYESRVDQETERQGIRDWTGKMKTLRLIVPERHKSCPSIPSKVQSTEAISPTSCLSKDISASNSEYEIDSPRSTASSTSFSDVKSYTSDEKRRSFAFNEGDFAETENEPTRQSKGLHRVHFAKDIDEFDDSVRKSGDPSSIDDSLATAPNESATCASEKADEGDKRETSGDGDNSSADEFLLEEFPYLTKHGAPKHLDEKPDARFLAGPDFLLFNFKGVDRRHDLDSYHYPGISGLLAPVHERSSDFSRDSNGVSDSKVSKKANSFNELQFEMDDMPAAEEERGSISPPPVDGETSSSVDDSNDGVDDVDNLQFAMDEVTPVSGEGVQNPLEEGNDASLTLGQKIGENFTLPTRSSGGCSPRRSQDYLYREQDESVEVTT